MNNSERYVRMTLDLSGPRNGALTKIVAACALIGPLAACAGQPRDVEVRAPIGRGEITWVARHTAVATPTLVTGAATAATPSVAAVGLSPTQAPAPLARYRGPGPYNNGAMFDVSYDRGVWDYVDDDGRGHPSLLRHRATAGCALWLRAGPIGVQEVDRLLIGTRQWHVGRVDTLTRVYWTDDVNPYFLGLILPNDHDTVANNHCIQAAETVIASFSAIPK